MKRFSRNPTGNSAIMDKNITSPYDRTLRIEKRG
jgi:hypothetical protein